MHELRYKEVAWIQAYIHKYNQAITPQNIQASFKATGLVPINPKSVISQLDAAIFAQTPSPAPELPPTPWVSKTPINIKEAVSQTAFL